MKIDDRPIIGVITGKRRASGRGVPARAVAGANTVPRAGPPLVGRSRHRERPAAVYDHGPPHVEPHDLRGDSR